MPRSERRRHRRCKLLSFPLPPPAQVTDGEQQVPSKSYKIPTAQLKEGVVAINFSESKNFEDDIKEKASIYCPGIGKATIVLLQRNLLRLREYQASLRKGLEQQQQQ